MRKMSAAMYAVTSSAILITCSSTNEFFFSSEKLLFARKNTRHSEAFTQERLFQTVVFISKRVRCRMNLISTETNVFPPIQHHRHVFA